MSRAAGISLLAIGLVILSIGWLVYGQAKASAHWPSADGVIGRTTITEDASGDSPLYTAQVAYSYVVAEQQYSGSLGLSSRFHSEAIARMEAETAHVFSAPITVYYDPANPSRSVLTRGVRGSTYMPFVIGGIFALAGLAFLTGKAKFTS